jgi:hypothetical protein
MISLVIWGIAPNWKGIAPKFYIIAPKKPLIAPKIRYMHQKPK